jgi:hypothetical protein
MHGFVDLRRLEGALPMFTSEQLASGVVRLPAGSDLQAENADGGERSRGSLLPPS